MIKRKSKNRKNKYYQYKTKYCPLCEKRKNIEKYYYKNPTTYDGLDSYCKKCRSLYNSTVTNKKYEDLKEQRKEWIKNNPEIKSKYNKKYYETHKEQIIKRQKERKVI